MVSLKLLVKDIVTNVKQDEDFYQVFLEFLDRDKSKRDILLAAFRRILIDESKKIYS